MKADNRNIFAIKAFLREYLDLRKDKDNELATVDSIRKGVEFKGANLWILIFAIFMSRRRLFSFFSLPSLRRSRNCWRVRHRPFMTFSSHFSADLPEWLPSLPRRKEM